MRWKMPTNMENGRHKSAMPTNMENGRHKVFNFQLSKLDSNLVNEKLDQVFEKLDCAAKINIALGYVLCNVEAMTFTAN